MPAPRPVDQLAFLRNLQRLLAESRVVATYKYALLHALADIAVTDGDDSGDAMRIATRRIAEQFVDLYWRQVAPFPGAVGAFELLQNTGKQAAVISRVREQRQVGVSTPLEARLDAKRWRRLVGKIDATVRGMPLQRLQLLGEELVDFLYANPQSTAERSIVLKPGAAWCLRAFHDLVLQLARSGWIQHVRAINLQQIGETKDLGEFLFGTARADLSDVRDVLAEVQRGRCFYCRSALRTDGQVDHFIPWSRYPVDLGHNFVLAHGRGCNQPKGALLAAMDHLERWAERNDHHGIALADRFDAVGVAHDVNHSRAVALWAYSQAELADANVWARGKQLVALDPGWRSLGWLNDPREAAPKSKLLVRPPLPIAACGPGPDAVRLFRDLRVAAGEWSDSHGGSQAGGDAEWTTLPAPYRAAPERFVARVAGESMNRVIPCGAWALFEASPGGSRQGKIVLVRCAQQEDPELGGYTLKRYAASEKLERDDGSWRHARIVLEPVSDHPEHQDPIVLRDVGPDQFAVVAEFIAVIPAPDCG